MKYTKHRKSRKSELLKEILEIEILEARDIRIETNLEV